MPVLRLSGNALFHDVRSGMEEQRGTDAVGRSHSWGDERLSLLSTVGAALNEREALQHALDQAVSELGGLAGLLHWSCGPTGSRTLRLVLASGLPLPALGGWEEIRQDEAPLAPARAVRDGRFVWLPAAAHETLGPGDTGRASSGALPHGDHGGVRSADRAGPAGGRAVRPHRPTGADPGTGRLPRSGGTLRRAWLSRSAGGIGDCDERRPIPRSPPWISRCPTALCWCCSPTVWWTRYTAEGKCIWTEQPIAYSGAI